MKFEQALKAMREGKYIFRSIKDKDTGDQEYLKKVNGSMRIFNRTRYGYFKMKEFMAFLTSQDILADDWEIYDDTPTDETVREMVERINNAMKKARIEFFGEDFDKPYEAWKSEHKAQDNEHLRADKIVLEHRVKALEKEISEKTAENNELRGQIKAYKDILQTFYGGD